MPLFPRFLVIDGNSDSRFLLVKTLLRKFPSAIVEECHDADRAVQLAGRRSHDAIVTHRTVDLSGLELLASLRHASPTVPIVMVSSIDRRDAALAGGANDFLLYDEWLRVGTVVASLMEHAADGRSSSHHLTGTAPAGH